MSSPIGLKYGKREPKNAPARLFSTYYRGAAIPTFPAVNYLSEVDWSGTMNGNDAAGDCVACATANIALLISTVLAGSGLRASQDEVWVIYKTQNKDFDPNGASDINGPGSQADGGMDIQTLLEDWTKTGFVIGGQLIKLAGFLKVDHTNLAELKAAMSVAGVLFTGVQVAAAQQQQFPGTWTNVPGSPIEGGHAIITGGHLDAAARDIPAACWAAWFALADNFTEKQMDEAWLPITTWHLGVKEFIDGMDLATFAGDISAWTGQPFPVAVTPAPVTPPAPGPVVPPPAPSVDPVKAFLASVPAGWENEGHTGGNKVVANAVRKLRIAEGLPADPG